MPFYTEHQTILMFFCLSIIHICTSSDKAHILPNNSQIMGLYDQRWFGNIKSHIVQHGLGQSLTLKSPPPTHHHTNLFRVLGFEGG